MYPIYFFRVICSQQTQASTEETSRRKKDVLKKVFSDHSPLTLIQSKSHEKRIKKRLQKNTRPFSSLSDQRSWLYTKSVKVTLNVFKCDYEKRFHFAVLIALYLTI